MAVVREKTTHFFGIFRTPPDDALGDAPEDPLGPPRGGGELGVRMVYFLKMYLWEFARAQATPSGDAPAASITRAHDFFGGPPPPVSRGGLPTKSSGLNTCPMGEESGVGELGSLGVGQSSGAIECCKDFIGQILLERPHAHILTAR